MNQDSKNIPVRTVASLSVQAGMAGLLVGSGLLFLLVLVKGWSVGLINSSYCGACGALVEGLFFAGRFKGPEGFRLIYAAGLGIPVGLGPPLASWLAVPLLGYETGPFSYIAQITLGLACGWVGAWLGGRKSRLPDTMKEIRDRRREDKIAKRIGRYRGRE